MKKSKNTLLAALAFSAAINLNGCVYGPPYDPSDFTSDPAISTRKPSHPMFS